MPKIIPTILTVDEDFEDHLDDVYEYDVENNYIGQMLEKDIPWMQDPQVLHREKQKAYYLSFFSLPTDWEYMLVNMHVTNQDFIEDEWCFEMFGDWTK